MSLRRLAYPTLVAGFLALPVVASPVLGLSVAAHADGQANGAAAMDPADNPADKAFIEAFRDGMIGMHKSMPTGDTDVDFARLVTPQNMSVAEMAKAELQYGKDEGLKAIARDILAARDREAAALKAWQDKHTGQ